MYENRGSFTLRDVIFNLLFIMLFIFLLLWLFPSKSFLNSNNNKSNVAESNQIFNNNIKDMKEAAILYFTTPRLPKKVGDSIDLTLKQMIDKKLILSLVDGNGNTCDEGKSYVEITKEDDEYVLKVSLSCSDKEDYILVHLGCYDYCEGDVCEKQEDKYKYQYKLETACKLGDFGAWSNWQAAYVGANNNRKVEVKAQTETVNATAKYSCPTGYAYNETTKLCYKSTTSNDIKDAEKIGTCPTNYTYDANTSKCLINENLKIKDATEVISCNTGFTYNETTKQCTKQTTNQTNPITSYEKYCPLTFENAKLSSDLSKTLQSKCIYTYTYTELDRVERTLSCTSKYVWDGGEYKKVTTCYRQCPGGYTINGSMCEAMVSRTGTKENIASTRSTGTYCATGTPSGNFCVSTTTVTDQVVKTYNCDKHGADYELAKDSNNNSICKLKTALETKDATITYSCSKYGSEYSLDGTKCKKVVTGSESAELIKTTVCPAGYTLNGTTCTRNVIYYRYSERFCTGGSVDYQWSTTDKDESLLGKGYILTGVKEIVKDTAKEVTTK